MDDHDENDANMHGAGVYKKLLWWEILESAGVREVEVVSMFPKPYALVMARKPNSFLPLCVCVISLCSKLHVTACACWSESYFISYHVTGLRPQPLASRVCTVVGVCMCEVSLCHYYYLEEMFVQPAREFSLTTVQWFGPQIVATFNVASTRRSPIVGFDTWYCTKTVAGLIKASKTGKFKNHIVSVWDRDHGAHKDKKRCNRNDLIRVKSKSKKNRMNLVTFLKSISSKEHASHKVIRIVS
jgi:hypothetical protein